MAYGVRAHGLSGTQDNLFAAGGRGNASTTTASTQEYDGTSFATGASLGTGMNELGASGTTTAGLVNGGNNNKTEELTGQSTALNLKTLTDS
jgi:hypothetical protein